MQSHVGSLALTSPAFHNNETIPLHYTCQGDNVSPPLHIDGVPAATRSMALIMHDPDAPNGDFAHWVVWNMPPSLKQVGENSVPTGAVQGATGFGSNKYGGPCPPSGVHHYIFDLYALDSTLNVPATTGQTELKQAMQGHVLDQTSLTGLFSKQ